MGENQQISGTKIEDSVGDGKAILISIWTSNLPFGELLEFEVHI